MIPDIFDTSRHRSWGMLLLAILAWHGWHTVIYDGSGNLLYVCYTAAFLLGAGICIKKSLFACAGGGWLLVAFPLWLFDAYSNNDWGLSCAIFHTGGFVIGLMALTSYRVPRYTWLFAISVALLLNFLAGLFTPESLNINAAFHVYRGWEGVFSNHALFVCVSTASFSFYFMALRYINLAFLNKIGKTYAC